MFLDKTLLLKGVAGVAAVGGVVGGGIAAQKGGLFTSSSKNAGAAKPGAVEGGNGQQDQTPIVDNKGIPSTCTADSSTSCSLTLEDLKKIKFKELDNGVADTVEPSSTTISLTLTITTTGGNKKYTFNNNGAAISLKKGEGKTVTLKTGTTEFTEEGEALKKVEGVSQPLQQVQISDVDAQGIPNKCTSDPTNCELTEEDLKKIKFQVLEEETSGEVSVENYPNEQGQKITLTIDSTDASNKRYIFNNPSSKEVKIKKGNQKSVTLAAGKKTKFTVVGEKLKERTINSYGLPDDCTNSCNLTSTDLEDVKFEALDSGTGTVSPSGKTVTLTIESSSSKKYKFNNTSDSAITIKKGAAGSEKTVTLNNGETSFSEGKNNSLKLIEPTEANGVPSKCKTTECTLTEEELKNIKFKAFDGGTGDVTFDPSSPSPNTITLSIGKSTPNIYTFKNSGTKVTLKKGDGENHKVILENGETEFTDESNKLVSYEDPDLKTINDNIGKLKLPDKCKFKSSEKTKNSKECSVTVDELKKVKFSNKQDDQDLNIETSPSATTIKLEIKKLNKNADQDQYGSDIKDNDPLIIFKNESSKITLKGSNNTNIIIPKGSNMEFLIKKSSSSKDKLSEYMKGLSSVPPSWGLICKQDTNQGSNKYNCTPYSTDSTYYPKFFSGQDLSTCQKLTIAESDQNKKLFIGEENVDDYNQGFKFQVDEVITPSSGSPSLTKNHTYEIKYSKGQKKWGFVKKDPAQ